jgi:uncharacterized protein
MVILINSSKTMVSGKTAPSFSRPPQLLAEAQQLDAVLKTYSVPKLKAMMHISPALAETTHQLIADWTTEPSKQTPALDSFAGDIYRGLQAGDFTEEQRQYSDKVLVILSGLYGAIRPLDTIKPYRLELMYKLKTKAFKDLYDFWQDKVAQLMPKDGPIINLTSLEYMRVIAPFVDQSRIIAPRFLTASGTPGHQTFITVHGKVARGAFARWLIKEKITDLDRFTTFNDLDYVYSPDISSKQQPTFVRPPLSN